MRRWLNCKELPGNFHVSERETAREKGIKTEAFLFGFMERVAVATIHCRRCEAVQWLNAGEYFQPSLLHQIGMIIRNFRWSESGPKYKTRIKPCTEKGALRRCPKRCRFKLSSMKEQTTPKRIAAATILGFWWKWEYSVPKYRVQVALNPGDGNRFMNCWNRGLKIEGNLYAGHDQRKGPTTQVKDQGKT